jgi:hypothetical protein
MSKHEQVLCAAGLNARERAPIALLLAEAGSRGGTVMRAELPKSLDADGRQGAIGYRKHLLRACIEEHSFFPT